MKTCLIAASAFGGIFASDIIRLSAIILKKNMRTDSMPEYIEREAVIESIISEPQDAHYPYWYADKIKSIPVVDVALVRHGRWERTADGAALCTACKRKMNLSQYGYAFCSLCGARMDGE